MRVRSDRSEQPGGSALENSGARCGRYMLDDGNSGSSSPAPAPSAARPAPHKYLSGHHRMTGFDPAWLSEGKYSRWLYKTDLGFRPDTEAPRRAILKRAGAWLFTRDAYLSASVSFLLQLCEPQTVDRKLTQQIKILLQQHHGLIVMFK
ncbi:unnamed protein product [Pleuronectes platessa]|uniref:Uncharacterized protein n=1 Tax=Pleuronectes platessa TaxID=8262 RepID=A0A9N7YZN6_PLEPL|nr:unnamed protein product [Pleuronectes platessa]